jgi:hypothetical protein
MPNVRYSSPVAPIPVLGRSLDALEAAVGMDRNRTRSIPTAQEVRRLVGCGRGQRPSNRADGLPGVLNVAADDSALTDTALEEQWNENRR